MSDQEKIQNIIDILISEAEKSNDAWQLDYYNLLEKYIKKAFELKEIDEKEEKVFDTVLNQLAIEIFTLEMRKMRQEMDQMSTKLKSIKNRLGIMEEEDE